MIKKTLTLHLRLGLHARPSAYIVTKFSSINIEKALLSFNGQTADPRSILSLLTLFAKKDDKVDIELSGPDEEKALKILEDIFNGISDNEIYSKK